MRWQLASGAATAAGSTAGPWAAHHHLLVQVHHPSDVVARHWQLQEGRDSGRWRGEIRAGKGRKICCRQAPALAPAARMLRTHLEPSHAGRCLQLCCRVRHGQRDAVAGGAGGLGAGRWHSQLRRGHECGGGSRRRRAELRLRLRQLGRQLGEGQDLQQCGLLVGLAATCAEVGPRAWGTRTLQLLRLHVDATTEAQQGVRHAGGGRRWAAGSRRGLARAQGPGEAQE